MKLISPLIGPVSSSLIYEGISSVIPNFLFDFEADSYQVNSNIYSDLASLISSSDASFARAGSGTAQNSSGIVQSFAANEPRLTDRGLLIEGAATNLLSNSLGVDFTSYVHAPASFLSKVEFLTRFGLNAVKVSDSGQWDHLALYGNTAPVGWISGSEPQAFTTINNRASHQFNSGSDISIRAYPIRKSNATGYAYINYSAMLNTDYNLSFYYEADGSDYYFAGAQVEAGTKATSLIETSGSPATRPADVFNLAIEPNTYDFTIVFDDNSAQTINGVTITGAGWDVPNNLNQPIIKSISGVLV